MAILKTAVWMSDSLKKLRELPEEVKDSVGYALQQIQEGFTPKNAKYLRGFKPAVMEIVVDHDTNTYRAVYTTKIGDAVYVLDCFQKKAKHGIKTPKQKINLTIPLANENARFAFGEGYIPVLLSGAK